MELSTQSPKRTSASAGGEDFLALLYSTGRPQTSNRGLALILLSSAAVGKTDPFLAYRGLGGKPAFQENANGFPNICIKKGGKRKAQSVGILLLYPRRNNANEIALENVFMISLKVPRNARNKTGGKAKQGQLTNLGRTHEQKWRDRALALCQWKHLFI